MKALSNIFIACLLFAGWCDTEAARLNSERYYQTNWCAGHGTDSVTEYRLRDATRVDCMAQIDGVFYAIEFDFADKWAEAIGQALYYARMTKRKPAVVLIVEDFERDMKYINRFTYATFGTEIRLFLTR